MANKRNEAWATVWERLPFGIPLSTTLMKAREQAASGSSDGGIWEIRSLSVGRGKHQYAALPADETWRIASGSNHVECFKDGRSLRR